MSEERDDGLRHAVNMLRREGDDELLDNVVE
jgi:hypothetical protein